MTALNVMKSHNSMPLHKVFSIAIIKTMHLTLHSLIWQVQNVQGQKPVQQQYGTFWLVSDIIKLINFGEHGTWKMKYSSKENI